LKRLGNSYYFNAKYEEAANVYRKLVETYPDEIAADYYFRYAQSLKTLGDYKGASQIMAKFKEVTATSEEVDRYDEDYLAKIDENSGRYTVKPFGYNSKYSDFAASFYEQGLIFSSDRDTGNLARYRHTWNSRDFLDLYKVNADSVSNNTVIKLEGDVNTRLHESTLHETTLLMVKNIKIKKV
jgi:tetratricopeptide (TPR) repeat protein